MNHKKKTQPTKSTECRRVEGCALCEALEEMPTEEWSESNDQFLTDEERSLDKKLSK